MSDPTDPGGYGPEREPVSDTGASRLEAFAAQLAGESDESPVEAARSRGWLDENGEPTQEGRDLLQALDEQRQTRSALRGLS
jgi:hypothetical protein